ncbi:MAG: hypothetical protein CMQ20_14270 [Gammaproteobacteria bacterium]|jgi:uncharacterized protein YbbC (DUF1343 family)|nr:hypothetical protein [Gammaproteobacteria bacterium]|tara:strand:+ start:77 stop:1282 length:1206 start_codon:yes stop_codon:yes gene_type:complete
MSFQFGIDRLLGSSRLLAELQHKNVALIAHPASVTSGNQHTLDALLESGCSVIRAFGPQHGMRGDKQDNMIESSDYMDPVHQIPVISLYGEHRFPTPDMLKDLDVILYDLQDIGCRIYTYISTLKYFVEACGKAGVELWVLDRPNPAGRPVDGLFLQAGEESFVGCDTLPTRHGLTVGELADWFNAKMTARANLRIIDMQDYLPDEGPGLGWPSGLRPWINPSPNAASQNMSRCFSGTVLLEGTTLSEGRGTSIPLEVIGAPDFPLEDVLSHLRAFVPEWLGSAYLRPCFFEPTFHKYQGSMCKGIQIHTDYAGYDHGAFKPFRLIAGLLKSLRHCVPEYDLWRHHEYEYESGRIPIDVINGGPRLRNWVDDEAQSYADLETELRDVENRWTLERQGILRY